MKWYTYIQYKQNSAQSTKITFHELKNYVCDKKFNKDKIKAHVTAFKLRRLFWFEESRENVRQRER